MRPQQNCTVAQLRQATNTNHHGTAKQGTSSTTKNHQNLIPCGEKLFKNVHSYLGHSGGRKSDPSSRVRQKRERHNIIAWCETAPICRFKYRCRTIDMYGNHNSEGVKSASSSTGCNLDDRYQSVDKAPQPSLEVRDSLRSLLLSSRIRGIQRKVGEARAKTAVVSHGIPSTRSTTISTGRRCGSMRLDAMASMTCSNG